MITKNIFAIEVIVEGETKIGQWPGKPFLRHSVKGIIYFIPGKRLYLDMRIVDNIAKIIKMPIAIETVRVNR
jgi:hypothetical protein